MTGLARIVAFTWLRALGGAPAESPLELSTWKGPPRQGKDQAPSRRLGPGLVGWRVLGANNRELGRGSRPSWRADEAYQAAREAQAALDLAVTRYWVDAVGMWFWNVSLAGEPIAVSSRGYRRQRECVYNVEQFREQFPAAQRVASHALGPVSTSRRLIVLPPVIPPVAAALEPAVAAALFEPAVAVPTREVTT